MLRNINFKFSAKLNLDEIRMTYLGLYAYSKSSATPVSFEVLISVVTKFVSEH